MAIASRIDSAHFPSPSRATWVERSASRTDSVSIGRRWLSQRQRCSHILATTRQLLAQGGERGVQLRTVASACGISVQTIYNLIGDREQLIREALIEWIAALETVARTVAITHDLNMAVVMTSMFWASPIQEPQYVSSVARMTASGDHQLTRAIRLAATKTMHGAILELREQNGLHPDVDPKSLSRQLIALAHTAICDWTVEQYDVARYWSEFQSGPGMMMRGATRSGEHERIARSLAWNPRTLREGH